MDSNVISLQISTAGIMQQIVWIGSSSIRTERTPVPVQLYSCAGHTPPFLMNNNKKAKNNHGSGNQGNQNQGNQGNFNRGNQNQGNQGNHGNQGNQNQDNQGYQGNFNRGNQNQGAVVSLRPGQERGTGRRRAKGEWLRSDANR